MIGVVNFCLSGLRMVILDQTIAVFIVVVTCCATL